MTKYVNRSQTAPDSFVGLLNDESADIPVTLLTTGGGNGELPEPVIVEVGDDVYENFRREQATPNQLSSEDDSHRYTVLNDRKQAVGTLYISRPRSAERDLYAVMYPPRGPDSADSLSRVERLRAKLAGRDPNDPIPF
jgi:hypothetical protein